MPGHQERGRTWLLSSHRPISSYHESTTAKKPVAQCLELVRCALQDRIVGTTQVILGTGSEEGVVERGCIDGACQWRDGGFDRSEWV